MDFFFFFLNCKYLLLFFQHPDHPSPAIPLPVAMYKNYADEVQVQILEIDDESVDSNNLVIDETRDGDGEANEGFMEDVRPELNLLNNYFVNFLNKYFVGYRS